MEIWYKTLINIYCTGLIELFLQQNLIIYNNVLQYGFTSCRYNGSNRTGESGIFAYNARPFTRSRLLLSLFNMCIWYIFLCEPQHICMCSIYYNIIKHGTLHSSEGIFKHKSYFLPRWF